MSDDLIHCALCSEYTSEDRDDFDWDYGPPICMFCMMEDDHEAILNLGFEGAIDDMDREAERGEGRRARTPAFVRRNGRL